MSANQPLPAPERPAPLPPTTPYGPTPYTSGPYAPTPHAPGPYAPTPAAPYGPPPTPPYLGASGKDFVPFGVGYIELDDVKVEARLTESDPDVLAHGMAMELVLVPFRTDADGQEVVTFAFRPVDEQGEKL